MEWENIIAATSDAGFTSKFYKERIKHTHTHTHTQKSNLKVQGKGCEQTFLQRGHTDGQQTYENMLRVTNYERNTN